MPTIAGKTVLCKKCNSRNVIERKSWILEGGIRANKFRIHLMYCNDCGKTFRVAEPI